MSRGRYIKSKLDGEKQEWLSQVDYIDASGEDLSNDSDSCQYGGFCVDISYGPITVSNYLQSQTSDWIVDVSMPTYEQIYAVNNRTTISY